MSTRTQRRGLAEHAIVALLDDRPGAHMAELGRVAEIPLPGRDPVRLQDGADPAGIVPGFDEADKRLQRLLDTTVHCPEPLRAWALEEVLLRRGELELHVALYAQPSPANENDAMARLTLRFQTSSGHVEGRVEDLSVRRHAASRSDRLAQARARAASKPQATPRPAPAPVVRPERGYVLDIDDDDDDDLPPPFDPGRMFEDGQPVGPPRARTIVYRNSRLIGLFGLFLAAVGTWWVKSTNEEAIAHERFNQRLAKREAAARKAQAATAPSAAGTTVRLAGSPALTGELDEHEVTEALLPIIEAVGRCYQELEGWATLPPEGTVAFLVSLGQDRVVGDVTVGEASLDAEEVIDCAAQAFEHLSGLEPGDGAAAVGLTLRFSG